MKALVHFCLSNDLLNVICRAATMYKSKDDEEISPGKP